MFDKKQYMKQYHKNNKKKTQQTKQTMAQG